MKFGFVTNRVILLLICGTIPIMTVGSHGKALAVLLGWNLLVMLLVLLDHRISPPLSAVKIRRIVINKLPVGEMNEVVLSIENHSFYRLKIEVCDSPPVDFKTMHEPLELVLPPKGSSDIRYFVTPLHRGRYIFGHISVRFPGRLELLVRNGQVGEMTTVDVYPNIKNVARLELRMRRHRLLDIGIKSERRRGNGTDFESLREYVRGDEFRCIDWKATARSRKLIVREYQSETNQSVMVLLDCGRAMGAKLTQICTLDVAVEGALTVIHRALRNGDNAGFFAFSKEPVSFIPPAKGKRHFQQIMDRLAFLQVDKTESDYASALGFIAARRLKRSLLILLTDLTNPKAAERLHNDIPKLLGKHLVVVVSILPPELSKREVCVPSRIEELWEHIVAEEILMRLRTSSRALATLGVETLLLPPERLATSILDYYLRVKLRSQL